MTKRDIIWIIAMSMIVGSIVTTAIMVWQMEMGKRGLEQQRRERTHLKLTHPARAWRVVPGPPYDYERSGE